MKKLLLILLFPFFGYGQEVGNVSGVPVANIQAINLTDEANIASINGTPWPSGRSVLIVAVGNTTNPYPYYSTNLGTSHTQGTQMTVAYAGIRNMCMGYDTRTVSAIINTASTTLLLYHSDDNGASYTRNGSISNTHGWLNVISKNGSALVSARYHTTEALWYSYDAGNSYTTVTTGLSDQPRAGGIDEDGSHAFFVSGYNTTGKYTTNSCVTWNSFTQPWTCNDACAPWDYSIWYITKVTAATSNQFAYSTNGGSSWTQVTISATSGTYFIDCSKQDGKYLVAGINGTTTMYYSSDYGQSWTAKATSANNVYAKPCMGYSGQYVVWGCATSNGVYNLSTDYGVNWSSKTISGLSVAVTGVGIME